METVQFIICKEESLILRFTVLYAINSRNNC